MMMFVFWLFRHQPDEFLVIVAIADFAASDDVVDLQPTVLNLHYFHESMANQAQIVPWAFSRGDLQVVVVKFQLEEPTGLSS